MRIKPLNLVEQGVSRIDFASKIDSILKFDSTNHFLSLYMFNRSILHEYI